MNHLKEELKPKTITQTSVRGKSIGKLKKDSQLSEEYENNPNFVHDSKVEKTYSIRDPHHDKILKRTSFITTPLTVEDVNEVLNQSDSYVSDLSPVSFESFGLPNEFDDLLDCLNNSPSHLSNKSYKYDETKSLSYTKNSGKFGEILNAVPNSYESFIKSHQHEKEYKGNKDLPSQGKSHELYTQLFNTNEHDQNILHQMVLSGNHHSVKTILDFLIELKSAHILLEANDKFSNTPFAYTIIKSDIEMAKLLLSFRCTIPKLCYPKANAGIPILHMARQVGGDEDNPFLVLICDYLMSTGDNEKLQSILKAKNNAGLNILHYSIVNYKTGNNRSNIPYILKAGSNLVAQCRCPNKKHIKVDSLGQAVFSKYPTEILNMIFEYCSIEGIQFKWDYVINNISYGLVELVELRTDISSNCKKDVIKLLEKFNKMKLS